MMTAEDRASLGSLAMESAYLEGTLDDLVVKLSGMKPMQAELVFAGRMMDSKLELVKQLGTQKLRSKKRKAELSGLIADLKHLNGERVTAIHGIWSMPGVLSIAAAGNDPTAYHPPVARKKNSTLRGDRLRDIAVRISIGREHLRIFSLKVWPRFAKIPYM
jgi:hypothetical protein